MAYFNTYNFNTVLNGLGIQGGLYYGQRRGTDGNGSTGEEFTRILADRTRKSSSNPAFAGLPSSMDAIFEEAASKYGVDVNLLKAIGKAESAFDASVVSQAGAIGVMQLMPATAASLGVADPYDARENIMGGASYIAGLLKKYGGDVSLALAAYNAGSGNVEKYGGIPPFKETQAYVRKVMEYAGDKITVNEPVTSSTEQSYEADAATLSQMNTEYLSHLVELMRIQMEMKFTSVLSETEV